MAAWFVFAIHFEFDHVQNRQYSNDNMQFQEEKSHVKLIRVSNIYTFKQQKIAFLQLSNFSNLRFESKSNVLFS